jgi:hypothetical protein
MDRFEVRPAFRPTDPRKSDVTTSAFPAMARHAWPPPLSPSVQAEPIWKLGFHWHHRRFIVLHSAVFRTLENFVEKHGCSASGCHTLNRGPFDVSLHHQSRDRPVTSSPKGSGRDWAGPTGSLSNSGWIAIRRPVLKPGHHPDRRTPRCYALAPPTVRLVLLSSRFFRTIVRAAMGAAKCA